MRRASLTAISRIISFILARQMQGEDRKCRLEKAGKLLPIIGMVASAAMWVAWLIEQI